MDQCSNGTTSHQSFRLLTDQGRHDLDLDLEGLRRTVLDPWRLGPTHLTHRAGSAPISGAAPEVRRPWPRRHGRVGSTSAGLGAEAGRPTRRSWTRIVAVSPTLASHK